MSTKKKQRKYLGFLKVFQILDLVDVPFSSPKYTWTNNRTDSDPIFERLDRAYATSSWFLDYPDTNVLHQPILLSDHASIILLDTVDFGYVKRPYRVENRRLSVLEVRAIVLDVVSLFVPGLPMFSLYRNLSIARE
ncbi:uncharacterized protein LOC110713762 [Chenopodium quinoa]|uniref:uncharacterized protein LOC110713762 n=1 Tax=Chenopodium quinoa TaxID=63459 RepID=UPI000B76DB81|nr:uncharacterized protein LOC110713762 [Chenopodium quinoa]